MSEAPFPHFRPVADQAILVEFGDDISTAVNEQVRQLDKQIDAQPIPGATATIPGYTNLLVGFDPLVTDHDAVVAALRARIASDPQHLRAGATREIMVCYDGEFSPDLDSVARQCGLSREAAITMHLAGDYRVYMYGFAPGYAYMAGVPQGMQLPRKPSAVRDVAAGSVIIAGPQCLVTTFIMPTGWWIIGRSPTRIIDDANEKPFLFEVGDSVRLSRIDRDKFNVLDALAGQATP